jgi:phosphatidylethanolamine/phosphatidyl-N-methylethanolamine N-methyltransferase
VNAASGSLRHSLYFFGRFLRHPGAVAAVWPSSRWLARAMLRGVTIGPGDVVVEFGPGVGTFTAALTPALLAAPTARYLGIDREPGFHRILQQRFPKLHFHLGDVRDVEAMLAQHGLPRANVVVSGLPFAGMRAAEVTTLLDITQRVLAPGGVFRTFSYLHSWPTPGAIRLRRMLRERFPRYEQSPIVWRNLPPAYVLGGRS